MICFISRAGSAEENERKHSLNKSPWALQFQIDRDFRLSSFQGNVISIKRHFSKKSAVRLDLSLRASVADGDNSSTSESSGTPSSSNKNESNNNNESLNIVMQYLIYPAPEKNIKFYFGAGPAVFLSRSESESINVSEFQSSHFNKTENSSWSVGVAGITGVEWFTTQNISFLAEYGLSFMYRSSEGSSNQITTFTNSPDRKTESQNNNSSFSLASPSVKFGLSDYF